jgi:hypothetical protein
MIHDGQGRLTPERSGTTEALDLQIKRDDDYAHVLEALYQRRYTGSFTVHCQNGVPRLIELPGVQIALRSGTALDKPTRSA